MTSATILAKKIRLQRDRFRGMNSKEFTSFILSQYDHRSTVLTCTIKESSLNFIVYVTVVFMDKSEVCFILRKPKTDSKEIDLL